MITTLYVTVRNNWEVWKSSLRVQNFIHHGHIFRDNDSDGKIPQHIFKSESSSNNLSYQFKTRSEMNQIL